jgi:uracil-DNA glycosylase
MIDSMSIDRRQRLATLQADASACTRCHEPGLVHVEPRLGRASPLFQRSPSGALGILVIGEAPNWDDTFDPAKRYLTYDADTDPTGSFVRRLLVEEVGLTDSEIDDVLFTNAVLCLPIAKGEKYPVSTKQLDHCRSWLVRLMDDAEVKVVDGRLSS